MLDLNKDQPHNIDIEKALLASLLNIDESFDEISDLISIDDFYAKRHCIIFTAIASLAKNSEPYDTVMVYDWLETKNLLESAGGEIYLGDIVNNSPATLFNLTAYANRLKELSKLRHVISIANKALDMSYNNQDSSVTDIIDTLERDIFAINDSSSNKDNVKKMDGILHNVINNIQDLKSNPDGMIGLSTNFTELNNKTQGLQNGDLIILAARPSMGKTTFAMNLAESILFQHDLPVVVFSMEMPAESIVTRMISSWGMINQSRLRSGQLHEDEWAKLMSSVQQMQNKKLYIDDSTALPPSEVRSRCRRIAKENDGKLGLVVIDYLQLMKIPSMNGNRVGEISEISRSLKALARELECPVVALSQLNRSLENRSNKRPIMSDLRESGAIEQDADQIMFIYRDEVYNENSDAKGQAEIIVGKNRNGECGTVRLAFEGQYTRFTNNIQIIGDDFL